MNFWGFSLIFCFSVLVMFWAHVQENRKKNAGVSTLPGLQLQVWLKTGARYLRSEGLLHQSGAVEFPGQSGLGHRSDQQKETLKDDASRTFAQTCEEGGVQITPIQNKTA